MVIDELRSFHLNSYSFFSHCVLLASLVICIYIAEATFFPHRFAIRFPVRYSSLLINSAWKCWPLPMVVGVGRCGPFCSKNKSAFPASVVGDHRNSTRNRSSRRFDVGGCHQRYRENKRLCTKPSSLDARTTEALSASIFHASNKSLILSELSGDVL